MSWFPVDDGAHSHPKMRRAGLESLGLWAVSGSFCMAYLTDGFVPQWFVKQWPRGLVLAKRLVEAGLWTVGERDGESGWWFHDWKPECTKERVEAAREQARIRKQKSREQQREQKRDRTQDSADLSRVTDTVTGRVTGRDCLVPAQPSPAQPISTSLVTSSGGVTEVDARDEPPPCRRHPNGTESPCRACAAHRQWREQRDEADRANELLARRRARALADNCPDCHGTNLIEITDNRVRKCDHRNSPAVAHA